MSSLHNQPMPPYEGTFTPGTPIDLRPAAQVAKRAAGPLGDFEYQSARVLARFMGHRVTLQDDGSRDRMADIRIDHPDEAPSFAEVWTDMDEGYAAMYSRIMKPQGQLPLELIQPMLKRVWFVTLSRFSNVQRLETEVGTLLAKLERSGLTFEQVLEHGSMTSHPDHVVQNLVKRGVVRLSSRRCQAEEQGIVRFYPSGISGSPRISWEAFISWVNETLWSPRLEDVRSKLAETRADERHVFVGVTYSSPSDVFFGLDDHEDALPLHDPELPPEVTHVWLMRTPIPGRCIAWAPEDGWFNPMHHWTTD